MILVGAGGFAKEMLEILNQNKQLENLLFYDDVNIYSSPLLFDVFPIIKSEYEASSHFNTVDQRFNIAVGKPGLRKFLRDKFLKLGGKLHTIKSKYSEIGSYDVEIGEGCNILSGVKISNSVKIGMGSILYYNSIITHDVIIGEFVEVSPGVTLLGACSIGHSTSIGSGSIILPKVKVGNHVIIGAGSIVTKDLPDNCTAVGVPAKIIRNG